MAQQRGSGDAAQVLAYLAIGSAERSRAIAASGCLRSLVRLFRPRSEPHVPAHAACVCAELARNSADAAAAVAAAGAAPALVALLRSADCDEAGVDSAACAVQALARNGQAEAVRAAGAVPALERLLQSGLRPKAERSVQHTLAALSGGADVADSSASTAAAQPRASSRARPPRVCANPACGATQGELRCCRACRAVCYCSEACSHSHWREYRVECRQAELPKAAASLGDRSGRPQPAAPERQQPALRVPLLFHPAPALCMACMAHCFWGPIFIIYLQLAMLQHQ